MTGLDTNILIRYIAQDDPVNSPKANQIMESLTAADPGWISITALAETMWVLTRRLHMNRADLTEIIEELLARPEIVVEQAEMVKRAAEIFRTSSADFSDSLVSCSGMAAGCVTTLTFDRKAAKTEGMTLVS